MLYADVYVDEPIEKIVDDWDFLHEKVLPKFMGFRPVGHNVYGMRQILLETPKTAEAQRGTGPVNAVPHRRRRSARRSSRSFIYGFCLWRFRWPSLPITTITFRSGDRDF